MSVWMYALAFFLTVLTVLGDYFLKLATTKPNPSAYIIGVSIVWSGVAFGWYWVMKSAKLMTLGALYSVMCIICLAVIGMVCFKEHASPMEYLGIVLAIISVVLLSRFS